MEEIFPALATALAAVAGVLVKAWWQRREKQKLSSYVKVSGVEHKPGANGWPVFATLIVTNLQNEKEAQRDAYEAKIAELESASEEKDRTIQQQRTYISALREEARSTRPPV